MKSGLMKVNGRTYLGGTSKSEDPELERTFIGHKSGVNTVDFCPTMKRCASGGKDNALMVWNFKPMMRAYKYLGHEVSYKFVRSSDSNVGFSDNSSILTFRPFHSKWVHGQNS
ncbi:POC1 centriolar protein [Acrasis kona]|uniref:POC1 centriolar protein n=1 Tax=Acrasis kona TaxID=1008807 RepID=A0AAW2Z006_9EUKA